MVVKTIWTFLIPRPCFENNLSSNTHENRIVFVDKSKTTLRGSTLDTGFSDEKWTEEWEKLKENGVYEVNFGDFLFYGIYI
jgi:hypothetical protein